MDETSAPSAAGPRGPVPGESFDGYLAHRTAEALMPGPFAITSLGGAFHAHYPQIGFDPEGAGDGMQAIADALDVPLADIRRIAFPEVSRSRRRFNATTIDKGLVERRTRRFSPASLADRPFHRAIWSVRCLPFCEESWETLTDRCPAPFCEAVQRWRRSSGVDRCDQCGTSLLSGTTEAVPVEDQELLRLICGLIHHDPRRTDLSLAALPRELAWLPPGEIVDAACAIAGLHDPDLRSSRARFLRHDAPPLRIARAMAEAGHLLLDWPHSGERLAADRLATRPGRFGDGNGGATLQFVELATAADGGSGLAHVAGMLADALRGNGAKGLPIKEAVVGTGLTVTRMTALRRSGAVGTVFHLEGDRIVPLIASASLERLRGGRERSLPTSAIASRLGITVNGVEQLLLSGSLMPAEPSDAPPFSAGTRVEVASCDRLVDRIGRAARARSDPSWIGLVAASRTMGGDLKPWGAWFDAILAGSVPALLLDGGEDVVSRLRVPSGATQTMRRMRVDEATHATFSPTMPRKDAVATLNLHARYSREAFEAWSVQGGHDRALPIKEVRLLAAVWIATPEIAALLGTSPARAARWMTRLGMHASPQGYDRMSVLNTLGLQNAEWVQEGTGGRRKGDLGQSPAEVVAAA